MNDKLIKGEKLSAERFKSPSREFGILPFWFWNGHMDYQEMEYQLREYYDKGIPGIFIHARFGIKDHMPYLSEDWFDRVKFTVEKAREIGLQIWVYDEYNWPSGTAGHQVMEADPDLTQRYLELVVMDIPGPFFTFLEGTDSRYIDMEQSEPVYACAILQKDFEEGRPSFIDLMPNLSFDKVIAWEAPRGPWKLFYFIERRASWYIDALDEDSTKMFLRLTHERYKASMNGDFSGKIQGFYTDEPAMHYFEVGRNNYIIPWSKKMFKIFREYNGYDLKPNLPKLYFDLGGDAQQVRYDFWSALTKQYERAYFKQIRDWCDQNQVAFTGHLLFEESLRLHSRCGGNLFNYLKHFHITGVDHLYPRIGTPDMPEEHVALKLGSSAAHHFGSTRLLCESMGGTYWDVTMERMKWIADWEYVLGVNLLNPHGFHYSIEGERKRDWPPSQFYHHTWWKYYGLFNEYISRLGYILSGGRHIARIAVLYPINSIWANYAPQECDAVSRVIEGDFNFLTDTLLRLHVDYDYIDEDVLKNAQIRDGKICLMGEEYSLLIMPPLTHIKADTLRILENFYEKGGTILADTLLPYAVVEGEAPSVKERIQALFGRDPVGLKKAFAEQQHTRCTIKSRNNEKGGKALLIEGPGLHAKRDKDTLKMAVFECIQPDIEIDNEDILYLHRQKDGKDFYFLINPVGDGKLVDVTIHTKAVPEIWNLDNGDIKTMPVYRLEDDTVSFKVFIEPFGSKLISLREYREEPRVEQTNITVTGIKGGIVTGYGRVEEEPFAVVCRNRERKTLKAHGQSSLPPVELGPVWGFDIEGHNTLVINEWKVAIDDSGSGEGAGYYKEGYDDGDWMDFKMGAWEMQLTTEREDKAYPVVLWYRTYFEADYIPEDIFIMIDGFKGRGYNLFINGQKVTDTPLRSHLDAEIKQVPVGKYVKRGKNSIVVKLTVSGKSDGIVDLLKIIGSFRLKTKDHGFVIVKPDTVIETGDWTRQGYPFFSGTGVYTQSVFIDGEYLDKVVKLDVDCGSDVLEVSVNGHKAGVRPWHPYELDVSQYLKKGCNVFTIKVTNTLINILEGVQKESGVFRACLVPYDRYEFRIDHMEAGR